MNINGKTPLHCIAFYSIVMIAIIPFTAAAGIGLLVYGKDDTWLEIGLGYLFSALFLGFSVLLLFHLKGMLKSVVRTFSLSGDMLHFKRVWDSSESSVSTDNFEYLSRRPGMYGGAVSIGLIFRDGGMIEFIGGTKQEKELLKHIETIVPYK